MSQIEWPDEELRGLIQASWIQAPEEQQDHEGVRVEATCIGRGYGRAQILPIGKRRLFACECDHLIAVLVQDYQDQTTRLIPPSRVPRRINLEDFPRLTVTELPKDPEGGFVKPFCGVLHHQNYCLM